MAWYEEIFLKESTIQKKKCLLISMLLVFRIWFHHGKTRKHRKHETGKVIATHTSDKGRVCTTYKEAQQREKKKDKYFRGKR